MDQLKEFVKKYGFYVVAGFVALVVVAVVLF